MSLGITFTESYHEIVLLHSLNQQDSLISKNMHATGNLLFSNRGCLFLRQPLRSWIQQRCIIEKAIGAKPCLCLVENLFSI